MGGEGRGTVSDGLYRLFEFSRNKYTFFPLVVVSGSQEGQKKDLSNVGVNMQASKEVLIFFLSLLKNALSIFCLKLVWSKSSP